MMQHEILDFFVTFVMPACGDLDIAVNFWFGVCASVSPDWLLWTDTSYYVDRDFKIIWHICLHCKHYNDET